MQPCNQQVAVWASEMGVMAMKSLVAQQDVITVTTQYDKSGISYSGRFQI